MMARRFTRKDDARYLLCCMACARYMLRGAPAKRYAGYATMFKIAALPQSAR